jgi:two-component system, OmpR family, alkaline phosphatase synthesis response regulator PhoP
VEKILIIENEGSLCSIISEMLAHENFEVIAAVDGKKGIELAQQEIPNLVICDVMMPELDGYGVLSILRQEPLTALIPFIFLTAKCNKSDMRQAMELGADDYLTKPFNRAELLGAVISRLHKQSTLMQQYFKQNDLDIYNWEKKYQNQNEFHGIKQEAFDNLIEQLRMSVAKANMAVYMMSMIGSEAQHSRYWEILKNECYQEMNLLNQYSQLRSFLTPENVYLLHKYNLIHK